MELSMIDIQTLETHATHSCNLSCNGCSHYSQHLKGNFLSEKQAMNDISSWCNILNISNFNILGGEPFLNKNLHKLCEVYRKYMPSTNISVWSNGLNIHKFENLKTLQDLRIEVKITFHSLSKEYVQVVEQNCKILDSENIKYSFLDGVSSWTARYKENDFVEPFDDKNPRRSWEICRCKNSPQLYKRKIYKCAPIAYLQDLKNRHSNFDKYLSYEPITSNQPLDKIIKFFSKEDEFICGMCPANIIKLKKKI